MNLYFNGCSHTFGDDLLTPDKDAWPAIIASKLSASFFNDAVSGGTNDRIVYNTIKNKKLYDKMYIAWTYTSRFTRFCADQNFDVHFNPQLVQMFFKDKTFYSDYGKLHYTYWYNELYSFKCWLHQIILLQHYLDDTPYCMINSGSNHISAWSSNLNDFYNNTKSLINYALSDEQVIQEYNEIQNLLNEIDFEHFLGWGDWKITDLHSTFKLGTTNHLLQDGHKEIARYILLNDNN